MFHLIQADGWKDYVPKKLCTLASVSSIKEMTWNHQIEIIDHVRVKPVDLIPGYFVLKAKTDQDILTVQNFKSKSIYQVCDNYGETKYKHVKEFVQISFNSSRT